VAYCELQDVAHAAGGMERLVELTDKESTGGVSADVLESAIDDADQLINSYAQKRFSVPFDPVPPMIRKLSARLAVYFLKEPNFLSAQDLERHQQWLDWLDALSKGRVTVGTEPLSSKSGDYVASAVGDREGEGSAVIVRDSLKGLF
jgi:phage gp36-like protein